MALTDLGAICSLEGRQVEMIQANYEAFRLTEDALQRMRILGDIGLGLKDVGAMEGARVAFEIVVGARTSFLVRTNAVLELMELESSTGNRVAFERRRAEAEKVRDRMPPSMLADLHYKSGVGLARFGQMARARHILTAGMELSESHRLNAWYFRFESILTNLHACTAPEPVPAGPPDLGESPAVQAVAVGLREYATAAS
jgi:hypothetical protein